MKKWYCKNYRSFLAIDPQEIIDFLNVLNDYNIPPENIKIVGISLSFIDVYYYAIKEIN